MKLIILAEFRISVESQSQNPELRDNPEDFHRLLARNDINNGSRKGSFESKIIFFIHLNMFLVLNETVLLSINNICFQQK